MAAPVDVTVVRLYRKSPGSHNLRKGAAAELTRLLAAAWHETHRKSGAELIVIRLERPRPAERRQSMSGLGRSRH